jgi:hypothetical protein
MEKNTVIKIFPGGGSELRTGHLKFAEPQLLKFRVVTGFSKEKFSHDGDWRSASPRWPEAEARKWGHGLGNVQPTDRVMAGEVVINTNKKVRICKCGTEDRPRMCATANNRVRQTTKNTDELRSQEILHRPDRFLLILLPGTLHTWLLMVETGPALLEDRYAKLDGANLDRFPVRESFFVL